ncbi:MAG: CYTH domain-containing protein [Bacilli bacterium]|nr:CYTH domain-containing protein [Bacilli bacterium]
MNTEIEIRILEIDHERIVKKLEELGAKKTMDALQERYIYDVIPKNDHKWIRLRTNGEKTTLTIKDLESRTIDGMKEIEIEVNDFKKTNILLENLGYKNKGFQQNRRVQYMLDDVEIDLDHWPLIPEYMEIEGKSEESVMRMLEILEIPKEKIVTLDVDSIYKYYGIEEIRDLSFDERENI